jgi:uncharacterized protein
MEYRDVTLARRSIYPLQNASPVKDEALIARLKEVLNEAPSAFNAQATRMVVALGPSHKKVWEIAKNVLRKIVPPDKFKATEAKLSMFGAAYGTVLLYEETTTVEELKAKYPLYAKSEDEWADQTIGILMFYVWTTLVDLGFGANMQHYNPLIDEEVATAFGVPKGWKLKGEIVFGKASFKPGPKDYLPIDTRIIVSK